MVARKEGNASMKAVSSPAISKAALLRFFVPFLSFGTLFAVIGINHVATRNPISPVPPIDYFYVVISAFIDAGIAAGLISLGLFSIAAWVKTLLTRKKF